MNTIDTVFDKEYLEYGIVKYIEWNFEKLPHGIIFGATGSGKTYLLKLILARISKHIPNCEMIICDYKSDEDFSFGINSNHLYRFRDCMDGLIFATKKLEARQQKIDTSKHFFLLVFDEWQSFISNLDKKTGEQAITMLATLLMLGRSFHIHVIISQQRVDAKYFSNARDNFSVVYGLGTISKESVEMLFSNYKDEINKTNPQGIGNLILGNELKQVVVPRISDIGLVNETINTALVRFDNS